MSITLEEDYTKLVLNQLEVVGSCNVDMNYIGSFTYIPVKDLHDLRYQVMVLSKAIEDLITVRIMR